MHCIDTTGEEKRWQKSVLSLPGRTRDRSSGTTNQSTSEVIKPTPHPLSCQISRMASVVGRTRPLFSLSKNLTGAYKACTLFSTSTPRPEDPAWRSSPTTMTSSEAFTETMVAHGVDNMFGIVGSAFMDALDIFPAAGIRWLITLFI